MRAVIILKNIYMTHINTLSPAKGGMRLQPRLGGATSPRSIYFLSRLKYLDSIAEQSSFKTPLVILTLYFRLVGPIPFSVSQTTTEKKILLMFSQKVKLPLPLTLQKLT